MGRLPCIAPIILLLALLPVQGYPDPSGQGPPLITPTFEGLDMNGDRIDDRIGDLDPSCIVDGRVGINVHLDEKPSSTLGRKVLSALSSIGADPTMIREGRFVNALYMDIGAANVPSLEAWTFSEHVSFIELRPPMVPDLDISSPAMRAGASEEYSPSTASDLGVDGSGINIAVLDTGVDNTFHETFRGRVEYGIDFTGPTVVYGADPDDVDGHGTHVAGIALGDGGSSAKYRGTAPDAGLVDIRIARIFGDTSGNMDSAFEWLIENHEEYNIRVVSVSFGSTVNSPGTDTSSTLANTLVDEGVVVVVAAGNSGIPGFPSPASADKVITVAASEDGGTIDRTDDQWGTYSNYGPRDSDSDQNQIDELKPDILAPGTSIMSAEHNTLGAYVTKTGTSMSCPHVSGLAALMLQVNPDLAPPDVKSILKATSEQRATPSYPSVDPKYNVRTGWGSADSFGAVRRASDLRSLDLSAPGESPAGSVVHLEVTAEYGKTEWNQDAEKLVLSIRTPDNFGKPEDITMTGTGGSSSKIIGPLKEGPWWVVKAEVRYNSTIDLSAPSLRENVRAPTGIGIVGSMIGGLEIGGTKAKDLVRNVSVVENVSPSDLSIVPFAIWFSDGLPDGGQNVDITVRVNNTDKGSANGCLVRIIDGPERTGETIGERTVDIPGGGYALVTVQWEANPGVHAITAIADPDNTISESVEDNNTAERPITVRGLNPPPMARLAADTNRTTILSDVTYDASSSSDTNVRGGNVVSYRFYYGDGSESGWVNSSISIHAYAETGTFTASVTVRDNGGAQSVNDASVRVEITDLSSEKSELYLDPGFSLVEKGVASGEIFFGPGDDTTMGTWTSDPFEVTTDLLVNAGLQLFFRSSGSNISARAVLSDDSGTIGESLAGPMYVRGQVPSPLNITIPTSDATIGYDGRIYLNAIASSDGEASLSMGKGLSRLIIYPRPSENVPPVADAGPDLEAKAGRSIIFAGSGNDTDGSIVSARWDINDDGGWETEGSSSEIYEYDGYTSPGNYTAVFEVRDDNGWWASDTAQVMVWPSDHNFPPGVTLDLASGSNLSGEVRISGGSTDDSSVQRVEVMIASGKETALPWTIASGTDPWSFTWNTAENPDGRYTVSARSYDGSEYSSIASVDVFVYNPLHPPRITEFSADPEDLVLDGETSISFVLRVEDADLPDDDLTARLDLSPMGGGSAVPMSERSGSGVLREFGFDFVPAPETAEGEVLIRVEVEDGQGAIALGQTKVNMTKLMVIAFGSMPSTAEGGDPVVISVKVEGAGQDYTVTANSTAFEVAVPLHDDGVDPDRAKGDSLYTGRASILSMPGKHQVHVEVRDAGGRVVGRVSKDIIVGTQHEQGSSLSPFALLGIAFAVIVIISIVGVFVVLKASSSDRRSGKDRNPDGKKAPVRPVEAIELG
jgi:subtilisin family serine protease